jgi:hypothetical protein
VVRCCERPCLVDGGFPPSGPQEDLTITCLTSLFCVHAEHTKALRFAPTPHSGAHGLDRGEVEPSPGTYVMAQEPASLTNDSPTDRKEVAHA